MYLYNVIIGLNVLIETRHRKVRNRKVRNRLIKFSRINFLIKFDSRHLFFDLFNLPYTMINYVLVFLDNF